MRYSERRLTGRRKDDDRCRKNGQKMGKAALSRSETLGRSKSARPYR